MTILQTAAEIYRDYEIATIPASGPHKPEKAQARLHGTMLEQLHAGGPGLAYYNKVALLADLAHAANVTALVWNDATSALNGTYQKSGASGVGTWTRIGDLPNSVVRLEVTGGSANAIVATATETPTMPGSKLYLLTPTANNTGAATIAVNGGSAVAIKNALGTSLAANSLLDNSPVLMAWSIDHYQLLISANVDASAILAAAQAAALAAEDARDDAITAAASAKPQIFETRAAFATQPVDAAIKTIYINRYSAGQPVSRAAYERGLVGDADAIHNTTDSEYWKHVDTEPLTVMQVGEVGGSNDHGAFQAAVDALPAKGGIILVPPHLYTVKNSINCQGKSTVLFRGFNGGLTAGADASSKIVFDMASGDAFNFIHTQGCGLEDLELAMTDASTLDRLVNFSGIDNDNITQDPWMKNVICGRSDSTTTAIIMDLERAIDGSFDRTDFTGGAVNVHGWNGGGSFSNVHTFYGNCRFWRAASVAVQNPGESWSFFSPTFEPLQGGGASAISSPTAAPAMGLTVIAPWCGDATVTGGTWFSIQKCEGFVCTGGRVSGANITPLIGFVFDDCDSVVIQGTRIQSFSIGISFSTECRGVLVAARFTNNTTNVSSGSNALPSGWGGFSSPAVS